MRCLAATSQARCSAALEPLGVTGLAVLAGGLRRPIAAKRPLLAPADWQGLKVASSQIHGSGQRHKALGATAGRARQRVQAARPGTSAGHRRDRRVRDVPRRLAARTDVSRAPHVAANVNLWPFTAALLANPDRLSRLTKDQLGWLATAAADAAARSTQLADQDSELAVQACASGARFANASAADLDALRQAFAPVYAELSRDPQTKTFIDRIGALKASTPREPALAIPDNCTPAATTPASSAAPSSTLDGVYRWTLTVEDARKYGTANDQSHLHDWYPTTFTVKLHRGICEISQTADPGRESGTFEVNGNRITFHWPAEANTKTFTFTVGTNGTLTLEPVLPMNAGEQFVSTTHPWTKIG